MTGGEVVVVLTAVVVGSFVKSVTGLGFPIIAIPVISLATGVEDAVVMIAVPNVLANAILCHRERASFGQTRDLPILVLYGILGAVGGTFLLVWLPERPLQLVLATTIAAYITLFFAHPDFAVSPGTSKRWSSPIGLAAGLMQGSTGISGPIVAPWIHSFRLPRGAYVFSITLLFFLTGATQLAVLGLGGEFTGRRIALGLIAVPPTLAMIPVGVRFRDRLAGRAFDLSVIAVLGVSGASLLIRGAS